MFSIDEVKEHAKMTNYNLGQAEKDLYQNLILFILYNEYGKELVFKGGTALTKCYGLRRFSEDLDFTMLHDINNIKKVIKQGLTRYSIAFKIKKGKTKDLLNFKILIEGPLYGKNPQSICSIQIDISQREDILMNSKIYEITSFIGKLPTFDVIVMDLQEIAAEKIRTILTRNQARDLFDLYYIVDFLPDVTIINKKLKIYNQKFNLNEFIKNVEMKEVLWDKELKNIVLKYPKFSDVKDKVLTIVKNKLK